MNEKLGFKLSNAAGISGREENIREIIKDELKGYVDAFENDNIGSLIGIKKGKGPKIMLAAHMDEVGFIVKRVQE